MDKPEKANTLKSVSRINVARVYVRDKEGCDYDNQVTELGLWMSESKWRVIELILSTTPLPPHPSSRPSRSSLAFSSPLPPRPVLKPCFRRLPTHFGHQAPYDHDHSTYSCEACPAHPRSSCNAQVIITAGRWRALSPTFSTCHSFRYPLRSYLHPLPCKRRYAITSSSSPCRLENLVPASSLMVKPQPQ